jgi:hypothetical protein
MRILNLDEITSEDKIVKIGEQEYIIPGDLPVEIMLRLIDNSNKMQENAMDSSVVREGIDNIINVFKIKKPDLDESEIRKYLTMKRYTKMITFVFGGFEEEEKKHQESSGEKTSQ